MATVLKQFTTVLITAGDYMLFGQQVSKGIIFSVGLMVCYLRVGVVGIDCYTNSHQVASGLVAGLNDLEFNFLGYGWMAANCAFSAGYIVRNSDSV